MSMDNLIRIIEKDQVKEVPEFRPGDTVRVYVKFKEGNKERTQAFEGIVISLRGSGVGKTFTVRRIGANGIGVERIFPLYAPIIEKIEVVRRGKVRRAKLYYLRNIRGKVKIKERR
ncbi:50S ribosomal protein L19 [Thermosipho melanesiensis]|uniref:Large ribosomal subunit protein bL19 n=2 Tax=Thermosipho melanesiensis TaxID=46541 RepID=RL19_THEM4|nr:50S ribosomal protein L19 [Thermosipho melanesiensis]A6LNY4.1 RecName: Full=Large ribosomal subunit protein bL19; AltName: Full=50S ribosomal protein L19 [Thermosipho melanesiensis BI429]ABR31635.1 ribosomal protein L19 [Thermosipho melanesiensis BI429]OOC35163.1 50S ribosomal protein L19 [Thermosipho melanesiensis]OOC35373.1 50S ribosomal protein L19 [Thermosipho melanesiensis]OOC36624.1 50S ribosomal protein L19 [Thermosipho melanesiensis]OOC39945.1 50S ribosomal protein L19 [Thermosipho